MELRPNNKIEDVFKNGFENFEPEVNPAIWESIQLKMATSPSAVNSSSSKYSLKTIIIASSIAAVVTTALLLAYFANNYDVSPKEITKENIAINNSATPTHIPAEQPKSNNRTISSVNDNESGSKNLSDQNNDKQKNTLAPEQNPNNSSEKKSPNTIINDSEKETTTPVQVYKNPINNNNINRSPIVVSNKPDQSKKEEKTNDNSDHQVTNNDISSGSTLSAKIKASTLKGNAPLSVTFSNNGNGQFCNWSFGDGTYRSIESSPQHVFEKPGVYTVILSATNEQNKTEYDSLSIVVTSSVTEVLFPSAFTPNGDGLNDVYRASSADISEIEIIISDIKGNQIAIVKSISDGWDGRNMSTGELCPEGIYIFAAKWKGLDGNPKAKVGTISLQRN